MTNIVWAGRLSATARRVRGIASLVAVAALAAACSSSGSSSGSSGSSGSTGTSGSSSSAASGVAYAAAQVRQLEAVPEAPPEGPALQNVASLKGKTVYYVPLSTQIQQFQLWGNALKAALATAGIKEVTCNGGFGNPAAIKTCLQEAITAKAGGVVTSAIGYQADATDFKAVTDAGIPLVLGNEPPPVGQKSTSKVTYLYNASLEEQQDNAWWIIEHSKGKAHILVSEEIDSPANKFFIDGGLANIKKYCPGCSVNEVKLSTTNLNLETSSVSAALLKQPNTDHVWLQYDSLLSLAEQGVKSAGFGTKAVGISEGATLASLKEIKSGGFVHAELGESFTYEGWSYADAIMRDMLGQEPISSYPVPLRLFDSNNINDLDLTQAALESSSWFGDPKAFQDVFKKEWGVTS